MVFFGLCVFGQGPSRLSIPLPSNSRAVFHTTLELPFVIPVIYALAMAASILIGTVGSRCLSNLSETTSFFHELSMNAPILYYFVPNRFYLIGVIIGPSMTCIASLPSRGTHDRGKKL